jgi:hypothetical protein
VHTLVILRTEENKTKQKLYCDTFVFVFLYPHSKFYMQQTIVLSNAMHNLYTCTNTVFLLIFVDFLLYVLLFFFSNFYCPIHSTCVCIFYAFFSSSSSSLCAYVAMHCFVLFLLCVSVVKMRNKRWNIQ